VTTTEALEAFAALNPVPPDRIPALACAPARERTLALIIERSGDTPGRRPRPLGRRRAVAVALALAGGLAVAVPALAVTGQLDSLFSFSNEGARVKTAALDLDHASAVNSAIAELNESGEDRIKHLATRGGVAFYVAYTSDERLCILFGRPSSEREGTRLAMFGCLGREGSESFPSPKRPILDFSSFFSRPFTNHAPYLTQLRGLAADGVASVRAVDLEGNVLVEAPVIENVYVAERQDPEDIRAWTAAIVAVDVDGKTVFRESLIPPRAAPVLGAR
jgi:hypothetical protein